MFMGRVMTLIGVKSGPNNQLVTVDFIVSLSLDFILTKMT